jgi:hypothetical protein
MTITLELPPEAEASLAAQVEARGLSLNAFLGAISATHAAALPVEPRQAPSEEEELDRVIDDLFDVVSVPPGVGEGAMRRENWYP